MPNKSLAASRNSEGFPVVDPLHLDDRNQLFTDECRTDQMLQRRLQRSRSHNLFVGWTGEALVNGTRSNLRRSHRRCRGRRLAQQGGRLRL